MAFADSAAVDTLERSFKGMLRYVSSVNQSRWKVVLDPLYETMAAAVLRDVPPSAELMAREFEDNHFFKYRAISAKVNYRIEDWNFDEARPELLTERQKRILHSFALGETSGFTVGAGFLSSFRNLPELGSFFGIWFTEELNHYWGYHQYLDRMGQGWTAQKKRDVTRVDFRDYSDDPLEVAAANMYQELIAYLLYRSFAKQARDPFLSRMIGQFAKDELRHYKFYEAVVAREIQKKPSFRAVALKHFFKATTPVNQVAGGAQHTVDHLSQAAFYVRKPEFEFLVKQNEFLFGTGFRELFRFFYRRHLPPCSLCAQEVFECACERYEDDATTHEPRAAA